MNLDKFCNIERIIGGLKYPECMMASKHGMDGWNY